MTTMLEVDEDVVAQLEEKTFTSEEMRASLGLDVGHRRDIYRRAIKFDL